MSLDTLNHVETMLKAAQRAFEHNFWSLAEMKDQDVANAAEDLNEALGGALTCLIILRHTCELANRPPIKWRNLEAK